MLDYAHPVRKGEIMTITRIASGHRMSQAVVHNDTVYIAGQVAAPGQPVKAQTEAVLHQIDRLLERAGSSKGLLDGSGEFGLTEWLSNYQGIRLASANGFGVTADEQMRNRRGQKYLLYSRNAAALT